MGREKILTDRTAILLRLPTSLNSRLEKYTKEFSWSKTFIIEQAIAIWLNARDLDAKDGLVKTK